MNFCKKLKYLLAITSICTNKSRHSRTIYLLEGQNQTKKNQTHVAYHLAQRHSPELSPFKTICNEFIEFAYYKTRKKN